MIRAATLQQLAHRQGDLVYMGLTPEVRLCTVGTLQLLGADWAAADVEVVAQQVSQQGVESISISLGDMDHYWANRLRSEFAPGIACQWHRVYFGSNGWETDLVFSGQLERPRSTGKGTMLIEAQVASGATAVVPRIPHESPWSLPRGSEVVLNGTTYTVGQ
jgi:hypothetical protein